MLVRLLDLGLIFVVFFATWFFSSPVAAAAANRTIDDSFGDSVTGQLVSYLPSTGVWDNQTCGTHCALHPDISQAFRHTYTATTYTPPLGLTSITMQFTGTAIYVFFILANNAGNPSFVTFTAVNFTLDQTLPQLFTHNPDRTNHDFQFNQLVFKQENLDNADHTLVISTSGPTSSFVNFDHAIYTFEDDTIPSAPPPPVVGGSGPTTVTETTISTLSTPSATVSSDSSAATPTPSSLTPSNQVISNSNSATTITTISSNPTLNLTTSSFSAPTTQTSNFGQSGEISQTRVPTGAIVGGVIGGLVIITALITLLRHFRNRSNIYEQGSSFPLPTAEPTLEGGQHIGGIYPFFQQPTSISPQSRGRLSVLLAGADVKPHTPFPSFYGSPVNSGDERLLVRSQHLGINENGQNLEELREQLSTLREQMNHIQARAQSASDAPPPY